ncbi:MAG TPA: carbamoyltransferase HypF [Arachidicoccus sp.]
MTKEEINTITITRNEVASTCTVAIHLAGIVQGVGFRPFVYRTARQFSIHGFVRNDKDGIFIEASGNENDIERFYEHILHDVPQQTKIVSHSIQKIKPQHYFDFQIIESEQKQTTNQLFITPDFAMCERCKAEMHNENNRRYHYPFITCTNCGPRYSILNSLPFDRANTSMQAFHQCDECLNEYNDSKDIRFYSQTNSCKKCGVQLQLFDRDKKEISGDSEKLISLVVGQLQAGKIIAVKGIGGFLLLCDAANQQSIKTLRTRKHRPAKPFAVMYPSMQQIEHDFFINTIEKEALQSVAATIVLLQIKNNTSIALNEVAPKLNRAGIFLPYAPLLELVLSQFGRPVIATSANISGESIVYENQKALQDLAQLADFILLHNRAITMPQDDSVIQFSSRTKTKIILRNGRGFSPVHFLNYPTTQTLFASGALLKSSFALAHNGSIYVSQYLGNTNEYNTQQTYESIAGFFLNITKAQPEIYVCDKHPEYFSTQFSQQQSLQYNTELRSVQHHKAHFAAVLAENNLTESETKILGVVWDGTGLGDDGRIWGGEFFSYQNKNIERLSHIEYTINILGDKMAQEPRLSALALCRGIDEANKLLKNYFTHLEWNYYQKAVHHSTYIIHHSSAGRLFDAVAALLGLCDKQSYEGEAALLLENIATNYWNEHQDFDDIYDVIVYEQTITIQTMLVQIVDDLNRHENKGKIALKFHCTLVRMIAETAIKNGFKKIAFSGGVFQNALLVDLIKIILNNEYELFFHQKLSPNDENISFGQIIAVLNNF